MLQPDRGVSRRRFLFLSGAAAAIAPRWVRGQRATLTVQDVVDRVQQSLGGTAPTGTVDGLKAGRPDTRVTGIVTTAMATADIVRRAAARGRNLVITYEPTFYAKADQSSPANRATDAVFAAKRALLDQHGVVVWRLHDQWLARRPDPMTQGLVEALGWQKQQVADAPHRAVLSPRPLENLVAEVKRQLKANALRVIGDPKMPVSRIVLSPGPSAPAMTFGNLDSADVILAGEPREWEGVEYVQDAITAGGRKAMILAGRVLTEDPGMRVMARWLQTVVPGVPIEWMGADDLYWRPQ